MHILVVDDSRSARELLRAYLAGYGRIGMAVNGLDAVERFRAALEAGDPYDLVLLDIMMPEMDGLAAAREINAMQAARGIVAADRAKLMVLSCLDDADRFLEAHYDCGVLVYLTKPFDAQTLREALANMGFIDPQCFEEPDGP